MRDRAKIVVNNREVGKRYLGSRLVWEREPTLRLIFQKDNVKISPFFISYALEVGANNIPVDRVTHIQINNKEIFKLKEYKLNKFPSTLLLSENEVGIEDYFEFNSWYPDQVSKFLYLKLYTSE